MDVALVEHAQHDVHGHHRRQDQQQGARQRSLERLRRALELGLHANRHADVLLHLLDDLDRMPQRHAGREVEGHHHRRELADVGDRQLRLTLLDMRQAGQAHLPAIGGLDVNLVQRIRADLLAGLRLQHHAVLTGLGVDRGNLPLTEGVVQRIGDVRHRHPDPRRRIAVDHQIDLQALVLQIAGDVGQFRPVGQGLDQTPAPQAQQLRVRRRHAELVLRAADPVLDGQVLHRLHEQANAHQGVQLRLQAADDLGRTQVALPVRLEIDQQAAAVERGVVAVHADIGRQALHRRILQDDPGQFLLTLTHGGEGDRLRRFGNPLDHPGVLHREEALGHHQVQDHRQA
ncbi:hypothetical protein D3C85_957460 [compost metagenome]